MSNSKSGLVTWVVAI